MKQRNKYTMPDLKKTARQKRAPSIGYNLRPDRDKQMLESEGPRGYGKPVRVGMKVKVAGSFFDLEDRTRQARMVEGRVVSRPKHGRFVVVRTEPGYCTTVRINGRGRMLI